MSRVLVVADRPGWAYEFGAKGIRSAAKGFAVTVAYEGDPLPPHDLLLQMYWGSKVQTDSPRIVHVASHRWAERGMTTRDLLRRLGRCTLIAPSRRLVALLPGALLTPRGYDEQLFADCGMRRGPIRFGWAGSAKHEDKGLEILRAAIPDLLVADRCLTHSEMPDFYNSIDVLLIASSAEGNPNPLIEAMACGCYVASTDVGIVPEVGSARVTERSVGAFVGAASWCRENPEAVRAIGAENARRMLATRTWSAVIEHWTRAFHHALTAPRRTRSGRIRRSATARPSSR